MESFIALEEKGINDLDSVARSVLDFSGDYKVWLLMGEMGAGKTTLSKALCKYLKVLDEVQSPTFSIVNEYLTSDGETIYHFDFYRLESEEEAMAIGIEDYFYSGNICLLEWPQRVESLLPDQFLRIDIEDTQNGKRNFKISKHG